MVVPLSAKGPSIASEQIVGALTGYAPSSRPAATRRGRLALDGERRADLHGLTFASGAGAKSHTVWVIVIPDAGIIALVTPVRLQLKRLNCP